MAKKELNSGRFFDIVILYQEPARLGEARRSPAMMSIEEDIQAKKFLLKPYPNAFVFFL